MPQGKGEQLITKLVAHEYKVECDTPQLDVGDTYTYFVDPETGKYYQPKDGCKVTATKGSDLSNLFVGVPPGE